jgi:hypothetical protein
VGTFAVISISRAAFRQRKCQGKIKRCIGYAVEENAIGTPCGIIPYEYNQHAIWRHKYGGDGLFYQELSSYYQDKIVLLDFIIYYV